MTSLNVIRTITVKGESQGVEKLASDVNKLAAAQQNVAVVSEQASKRVLSVEEAYRKQSIKLDEAARSQANIARETKIANDAQQQGLITQQQHADRLNLISQRYAVATQQAGKFANQTGLNRYELLNFSRQIHDIGVSLAGGQNPFVVLTQQGSQIADIFQATNGSVRGFATQAIGWLARFATSTAGVVTGVGAIGLALASSAHSADAAGIDIQRSLSGVGRTSGLTARDLLEVSRQTSSWATISTKEARSAAEAFANAGVMGRDNLKAANSVALDFAKTLGVDLDEGIKILAKDLTSGISGIDDLGKRLGGLTSAQREYLQDLDANIDKTKFQAAAIKFVSDNISRASDLTTFWGDKWNRLSNIASNVFDAPAALVGSGRLDSIRKEIAAIEEERQSLIDLAAATGRSGDIGKDLSKFSERLGALRLEATRLESGQLTAKFGEWGRAAIEAAEQFAPLEKAAEDLERKLKLLRQAQGDERVRLTLNPDQNRTLDRGAAAVEVKGLITREHADEAARYNQRVLEIAASFKEVGVSTALSLNNLQTQLPVAQAIGAAARLAAQEQATYTELGDKGKTAIEAASLAEAQRAIAQAQINAAAQENLLSLKDQEAVARAVTGIQQMQAQEQAIFNELIRQGVSEETALATAAQQTANAKAAANANADRMLRSLQQEGELIRASSDSERERIAARQTYDNLVGKGVEMAKAAAVAQQQLANATQRREEAERKAAEDAIRNIKTREDAWSAYNRGAISWSVANDEAGRVRATNEALAEQQSVMDMVISRTIEYNRRLELMSGILKNLPALLIDAMGGIDKLFDSNQGGKSQFNPEGYKFTDNTLRDTQIANANRMYGEGNYTIENVPGSGANTSLLRITPKPLTDEQFYGNITTSAYASSSGALAAANQVIAGSGSLQNEALQSSLNRIIGLAEDRDKISIYESEIAKLNADPRSLARDELIASLTEQLKRLKDATEDNTNALNAQLDPLFSQGHDYINKLQIGYFKAATGLHGMVGGAGGIDSKRFVMDLTPGELVNIIPPGQWTRNSTANDNSNSNNRTVIQNNTFNINGEGSASNDRFTTRQRMQGYMKAAAMAVGA